jgi:hypothetical protein
MTDFKQPLSATPSQDERNTSLQIEEEMVSGNTKQGTLENIVHCKEESVLRGMLGRKACC